MLWRAVIVWFALFVSAFLNGALREILIKNIIGVQEPLAHQLSCLTGAILWTSVVWLAWRFLGIATVRDAAMVGAEWFVATLLTETFLINRLMSKLSWSQIFQTYNVMQGEYWGLVLVYIGLLPIILFLLRRAS